MKVPDGPADDRSVMVGSPKWPTFRTLWLWLRQGCPRQFPVITRRGQLIGPVSDYTSDGTPFIDASDITVRGWSFDFSLCEVGVYQLADLALGLQERYPVLVVHPDGREELVRCEHLPY